MTHLLLLLAINFLVCILLLVSRGLLIQVVTMVIGNCTNILTSPEKTMLIEVRNESHGMMYECVPDVTCTTVWNSVESEWHHIIYLLNRSFLFKFLDP